jgi:hypothetical protein
MDGDILPSLPEAVVFSVEKCSAHNIIIALATHVRLLRAGQRSRGGYDPQSLGNVIAGLEGKAPLICGHFRHILVGGGCRPLVFQSYNAIAHLGEQAVHFHFQATKGVYDIVIRLPAYVDNISSCLE